MKPWLEVFTKTRGVVQSCDALKLHRTTPHRAKKVDPVFARAWAEAEVTVTEQLELSALGRAIEGWLEPVFFQGVQVGEIRRFSNSLTIFLLKCRKPSVYNIAPGQTGAEVTTQDQAGEIRDALALMERSVGGKQDEQESETGDGENASSE